jgi:hypothetical protein
MLAKEHKNILKEKNTVDPRQPNVNRERDMFHCVAIAGSLRHQCPA